MIVNIFICSYSLTIYFIYVNSLRRLRCFVCTKFAQTLLLYPDVPPAPFNVQKCICRLLDILSCSVTTLHVCEFWLPPLSS